MELFVAAGIMMRAAQVIFLSVFTRLTVESCSKPRAFIATEGMNSVLSILQRTLKVLSLQNRARLSVATRVKILSCIYVHNLLRSTVKKPV